METPLVDSFVSPNWSVRSVADSTLRNQPTMRNTSRSRQRCCHRRPARGDDLDSGHVDVRRHRQRHRRPRRRRRRAGSPWLRVQAADGGIVPTQCLVVEVRLHPARCQHGDPHRSTVQVHPQSVGERVESCLGRRVDRTVGGRSCAGDRAGEHDMPAVAAAPCRAALPSSSGSRRAG